jgi:lysine-N-methylase
MKLVRPSFYDTFRCKAAACRHTCCAGWEICIDEETLAYYQSIPGKFGEKLRGKIGTFEGDPCFVLTPDRRCPFLRDDNLCEMILTLGEDALCEICREHPRFYEFFDDVELWGLGLSCEAVAELLLREKTPLVFLVNDGEKETRLSLPDVCALCGLALPPDLSFFDPQTGERLLLLHSDSIDKIELMDVSFADSLQNALSSAPDFGILSDAMKRRIYTYILYRQLERTDEYGMDTLCRYASFSVALILRLIKTGLEPVRALSQWSEEIEYSTENVDILLDALSL